MKLWQPFENGPSRLIFIESAREAQELVSMAVAETPKQSHQAPAPIAIEPEFQRRMPTLWREESVRVEGHRGCALLSMHLSRIQEHFGPRPEGDPTAPFRILAALEEEARRDLAASGDACTGVRYRLLADSRSTRTP